MSAPIEKPDLKWSYYLADAIMLIPSVKVLLQHMFITERRGRMQAFANSAAIS